MRTRTAILAAVGLFAAATPSAAFAGPFSDELSRCWFDARSEADRTVLMRWTFLAVGAHPDTREMLAVTPDERRRISADVGALFTRLLLTDCRRQTIQAVRTEGAGEIETGFQVLGMAASRELMGSQEGAAVIAEMQDYLDSAGIDALMAEAGTPVPVVQ